MVKSLRCFTVVSLFLFSVNCFAAASTEPKEIDGEDVQTSPVEPTVYADVSEEAIESAVSDSFDGPKAALGLYWAKQKQGASIGNVPSFTYHGLSTYGVTARFSYDKMMKNNLVIALEGDIGFAKKKKKKADRTELNAAFLEANRDETVAATEVPSKGKIETPLVVPSLAVKGGMAFPKYKISGYAKIGVTRACAKYVYYDDNNNEKAKIEAAKFIPFFCVGLEKKFTPKWGVALEVDVSIKKEYKKQRGDYLHKIKLSRNCVRLMATYSMSLNK